MRRFLLLALLLAACGGGAEGVTVILEPTVSTDGSYGVGMTLHLYELVEEVDASGELRLMRADQPSMTKVTDSDRTAVFDWERDRPFRIQADWMEAGGDCWVTADGNFFGGDSSVSLQMLMVCA